MCKVIVNILLCCNKYSIKTKINMRKFALMLIGLCFFVAQSMSQNRIVTGTVVDEAGVPI